MIKKIIQHIAKCLGLRRTIVVSNVAEGSHTGGVVTYSAAAAISSKYLFGRQTTTLGQIAVAGTSNVSTGARAIGVITDEAEAAGDPVAVAILGSTGGTQKVLAGGTIAVGDLLTSDSTSRALAFSAAPASATYYIYGVAITAAAAGELVEFAPFAGIEKTK